MWQDHRPRSWAYNPMVNVNSSKCSEELGKGEAFLLLLL